MHFVDWPWSLRFGVVPWLDEAEGLPPRQLPDLQRDPLGLAAGGRRQRRAGDGAASTVKYALAGARDGAGAARRPRATTSRGRASRREPERWTLAGARRAPAAWLTDWPGGARGAVSVSFDNLGEAAELELGRATPTAARRPLLGHHGAAARARRARRRAAERDVLRRGRQRRDLPGRAARDRRRRPRGRLPCVVPRGVGPAGTEEESANLSRGLEAMRAIGLEPAGSGRPAAGSHRARSSCSAARAELLLTPAARRHRRVVVLPFAWPAVDVFHVIPPFAALRKTLTGSEDAGGAEAVRGALLGAVEEALASGGLAVLVLHAWMIELELDVVREVLARVRAAVDAGELWAMPCRDVAAWMTRHAASFGDPPALDDTSWTAPSGAD